MPTKPNRNADIRPKSKSLSMIYAVANPDSYREWILLFNGTKKKDN